MGGNAHETTTVFQAIFLQGSSLNGVQGQEGGPAAAGALQVRDGCLAVCLAAHNDLLHGCAQGDFHGHGVSVLRADQTGNRPMDIPQSAPLGLLHYHADRLIVAFKVPLHGPEHPGLCRHGIQRPCQFPALFFQFIPTLAPGALAKSVAGDGVVGGGDIVLSGAQFFAAIFQVGLGLLAAGSAGFQVPFQLFQPGPGLDHTLFQAPHIRLSTGDIRREGGLFAAQLQILPGDALGIGHQGRQLLLALGQGLTLFRQGCLDFRHTGIGLADLGSDAAAAVLLPL